MTRALTLEDRIVEAQVMFNAIDRIAGESRDDVVVADLCSIGVRILSEAVEIAQGMETDDNELLAAADEYWRATKLSSVGAISHEEFIRRTSDAQDIVLATAPRTLPGLTEKLKLAIQLNSGGLHVSDLLSKGRVPTNIAREDHEMGDFALLQCLQSLEAFHGR